jgi:hypothetical protein
MNFIWTFIYNTLAGARLIVIRGTFGMVEKSFAPLLIDNEIVESKIWIFDSTASL